MSPPVPEYAVERVETAAGLAERVAVWDELAAEAVEANVFYESWMLRPALEAFAGDAVSFTLVHHTQARAGRPPRLVGFFPLVRRRCPGVPVRGVTLWHRPDGAHATPLLHRDHARAALAAFLDALAHDPAKPAVLELPLVPAEGPFAQALLDVVNERRAITHVRESHTRAFFRPDIDATSYCDSHLSATARGELRRQRKRFAGMGRVETRVLSPGGDVDSWTGWFLELEKRGQKAGGPEPDGTFFRTACREAHARGRLLLIGLFLDGRPVAMKCSFVAGAGAVVYRSAYDPEFASFSPGVLVELDHIEELHRRPAIRYVDSTGGPRNGTADRLWKHRRAVQTLLLSTGRWGGTFALGLLPLFHAWGRPFRRPAPPPAE